MTAVILGAFRTLINFHTCFFGNSPREEILQSGLTCLLGLCSHFEQKRGFFMQGCPQLTFAQAPTLHQSGKATKAKGPRETSNFIPWL